VRQGRPSSVLQLSVVLYQVSLAARYFHIQFLFILF